MRNRFEDIDWGKVFGGLVENGIFILGAILMYAKTAELMAAFAPKEWLGYDGIQSFYGMLVGLMVEGVFIIMKWQIGRSENPLAWLWNLILIGSTFIISTLAQGIDSIVIANTLSAQPAEIQFLVTWGVPAIPALLVGLILLRSIIQSVPSEFVRGLEATGAKLTPARQNPRVNSGFQPKQAVQYQKDVERADSSDSPTLGGK